MSQPVLQFRDAKPPSEGGWPGLRPGTTVAAGMVIERDVAEIFVRSFKPELFQVRADGSLSPRQPGITEPIAKVELERS